MILTPVFEATTLALRAAVVEADMVLSGDDRIGECNAAQLLGLEVESFGESGGQRPAASVSMVAHTSQNDGCFQGYR